jgi:hypothetical protein
MPLTLRFPHGGLEPESRSAEFVVRWWTFTGKSMRGSLS